jgi:hypothetical protein
MEAITGQKIKPAAAGTRAGTEAGARVRGTAKGGKVAGTLRAGLRELAQSDARTAREMAAIVRDATPKVAGGKGGKAIRGGRAALPAAKPKPASKPAAGSIRTVNRTRAEAAAAYKKRIRPARAAAARMAPADKPVSSSRPDGNLILGRTWEQIQAAQKGAKRALDGGPITGKAQKPRATQGDRRLLAQKGMKGLKAEGLNGVLDRLRTSKVRIGGKPKSSAGIRKPPSATKPAKPARARRSKPDLSQGSFERRARATEKRAKAAERVVSAIDRFNPANRRLVNRANSLRSAADSYAYYARRGKNDPDFSAADLFKGRSRSSTAPRLTRSEKAAATRRAKADKRFRENVRRMEQDRRR